MHNVFQIIEQIASNIADIIHQKYLKFPKLHIYTSTASDNPDVGSVTGGARNNVKSDSLQDSRVEPRKLKPLGQNW